ncbi:putative kinase-like protein TMKL1 isoform X2 [Zingiber officinale]|uniref:putative kinase-like protein TMKL1 isoform X2 n=1 Tax=Zingiber officinale TaxID=94328 RepID=UPI001C4B7128|nr:putative kinase-like protein TMKL1 isoform X2 [Zingiber officinale]
MEKSFKIRLLLGLLCSFVLLLWLALCFVLWKRMIFRSKSESLEAGGEGGGAGEDVEAEEGLVKFAGGECLTVHDILDAPGEVVSKSGYGTLYRASIEQSGAVLLLRFVRPACVARIEEVLPAIRVLGAIRHPNVVPLRAMYVGPRGEKLLVHPFYAAGSLKQLLRAGVAEAHRWDIIYRISIGIAKGLNHLHTGLDKPIVHGHARSLCSSGIQSPRAGQGQRYQQRNRHLQLRSDPTGDAHSEGSCQQQQILRVQRFPFAQFPVKFCP